METPLSYDIPDAYEPVMVNRPQFGVVVQPKPGEFVRAGVPKLFLALRISTGSTEFSAYLCDADDNFTDIARNIEQGIVEAGRKARQAQSGLMIPKGVNSDALRTEKQGRVKR
jgi:hypothetical protein